MVELWTTMSYLLMIGLIAAAGVDKIRERLLGVRMINVMEKRLEQLKRYEWLAAALCLALGVAVRVYRFCELPLGVNQDGAVAGAEALSLLRTGMDQHGNSWPTYFESWGYSQMSTLYSYLLIPFIMIFGKLDLFVLRLPMLLFSLAALPLTWDLARRMLGRGYALAALFVTALNPWQIMQSRWALEANLMPHIFLIGVYLLMLGRTHKLPMYLSMVFFALTPYAYGVASFSTPVFLLLAACHYVGRRKARIADVLICVAVFAAVAWPYYYTMAINAFGLETMQLGPFTMPFFEESKRTNDLVFSQPNPYQAMLGNLFGHASTYLFTGIWAAYNAISWIGPMYMFMTPVFVCGLYLLWHHRRCLAAQESDHAFRDGGMLLLAWMAAAVFSGMMIGGVINRNNAVYYPLILLSAYGFVWMGKRLKTAMAAAVVLVAVGFVGFSLTYFTDETYQEQVGTSFNDGLYEALTDTWDWDYDRYYVSAPATVFEKIMKGYVMFAHGIDYSMLSEETDLKNSQGESTGWYFGERYAFVNFEEFETDPMECAVYIIGQNEKAIFDEQTYLIKDYGQYAAAYPKYWLE